MYTLGYPDTEMYGSYSSKHALSTVVTSLGVGVGVSVGSFAVLIVVVGGGGGGFVVGFVGGSVVGVGFVVCVDFGVGCRCWCWR